MLCVAFCGVSPTHVKNLGFHGLFDTDVLLSVVAAVAWAARVVQIPSDYTALYHLAALGSCPGYRPKAGEISKTLLHHLSSLTANHLKYINFKTQVTVHQR